MSSPGVLFLEIIHVRQIAKYIAYDKSLRNACIPNSLPGIPTGYLQLANIFNDGIRAFPRDQRRFSTFLSDHAGDHVFKPGNPVTLKDFRITPEQCGLVQPPRFATLTEAQSIVFQEYATQKALDEVKKREQSRNAKINETTLAAHKTTTRKASVQIIKVSSTTRIPLLYLTLETITQSLTIIPHHTTPILAFTLHLLPQPSSLRTCPMNKYTLPILLYPLCLSLTPLSNPKTLLELQWQIILHTFPLSPNQSTSPLYLTTLHLTINP